MCNRSFVILECLKEIMKKSREAGKIIAIVFSTSNSRVFVTTISVTSLFKNLTKSYSPKMTKNYDTKAT